MIDPRFFLTHGPMAARALAPGAEIVGDAHASIETIAPAEGAGAGVLCFWEGGARAPPIRGVVIARDPVDGAAATILSAAPRAAFARLAARLVTPKTFAPDAPMRDPSARLEENVRLAPGVVIGPDAQIGGGTTIGPNAVIGPGVVIGRGCRIGAQVVIACALIGDGVEIQAGAVIGEAGFGVAGDAAGLVAVPHVGRAIIQDRVLIGALTTVDRGAFDDTIVGEEAKLDNHCHVAHNVVVGRRAVMAAYAGLSGTARIGEGVMMDGRVGLADHVKVGDGAQLAAGSAVLQDVPAGETWAGYPARPIRAWMREIAWLKRAAARKNEQQ